MDDSDTMPASPRFGTDRNYLWGDLPACDILNVPTNEGVSIKNQDLNLCFAASGDPRNLIKTVNGLPLNYSGRCTLVINDHHPQVAIRNLIILGMLLDPCGPSIELAAEAALHALYSASLTSAQYDFVGEWMDRVSELGQRPSQPFHGEIKFNSDTSMEWLYPEQVGTLLQRIKAASYSKPRARRTDVESCFPLKGLIIANFTISTFALDIVLGIPIGWTPGFCSLLVSQSTPLTSRIGFSILSVLNGSW